MGLKIKHAAVGVLLLSLAVFVLTTTSNALARENLRRVGMIPNGESSCMRS